MWGARLACPTADMKWAIQQFEDALADRAFYVDNEDDHYDLANFAERMMDFVDDIAEQHRRHGDFYDWETVADFREYFKDELRG